MRRWSIRIFPPGLLLLAVIAFASSWNGASRSQAEQVLSFWVVEYQPQPFDDAAGVLGMVECERRGLETYRENPCDPQNRPFVYPPTWKLLSAFRLDARQAVPLALTWIALLLAALFAMPPARDWRGALLLCAAMLSPATAMAIEFGNSEMLVFALAVAAALLLTGRGLARLLGYAVLLAAAFLKYFPLVGLAAAIREKPRAFAAVASVAVVSVGLAVVLARSQVALALSAIGSMSPFSLVFGLSSVSVAVVAAGLPPIAGLGVRIVLTLMLLRNGLALGRRAEVADALRSLDPAETSFLLVGGLLLVAAYLLGQSVDYRQVYTIMVLPALWQLRSRRLGWQFPALAIAAVALMYEFPLRVHLRELFPDESLAFRISSVGGLVLREAAWFVYVETLIGLLFAALNENGVLVRMLERFNRAPAFHDDGSPRRSRSG